MAVAGERAYDIAWRRGVNARGALAPRTIGCRSAFITGVAEGPVAGRGLNRETFCPGDPRMCTR